MPADAHIRPTSAALAAATRAGEVAPDETIDERTFVVPMPTRFPFIVSTLCYVLLDRHGAAHVIDPGVDDPDNLVLLARTLRERDVDRVASVTATHLHVDHLGLADRLRRETGARLILGRVESEAAESWWRDRAGRSRALEAWGVPVADRDELASVGDAEVPTRGLRPDRLLDDGDGLEIDGRRIRALATPGHTPGHLCFVDDDARRVFTGDHVLPHLHPGVGLGDPFDGNPVDAALASLDALAPYAEHEALPGHGYRFTGLGARAAAIARHHRDRSAEVAAVLAQRPDASVWEVASRIRWTAGWDALRGFHRLSALAQVSLHVERVRRTAG